MTGYPKGDFPEIVYQGGQTGWCLTSHKSYELEDHMEAVISLLPEGPVKENQIEWFKELKRRK
jgi:hypothetical protein